MGTDYIPGDGAGEWRQDPISQAPVALGSHWADVKPFVIASASQFRIAAVPGPDAAPRTRPRSTRSRRLGGDGVNTPDQPHRGPDADRHLLGVRRHAQPVRAAAALQPDRDQARPRARRAS